MQPFGDVGAAFVLPSRGLVVALAPPGSAAAAAAGEAAAGAAAAAAAGAASATAAAAGLLLVDPTEPQTAQQQILEALNLGYKDKQRPPSRGAASFFSRGAEDGGRSPPEH
ncbi:uncharacterized protein EMH_0082210 [Eimeria mitis]|uniref:Uncharacterized protein n=1 Tax=Eimeria mitis TaxID=44415 RepID=U6KB01_9EIME|nr:uncharacterized protein EMH_0082210 [Eimeria mitis]CDJ33377.1 hypothetical protein EMH_0082210 [Eimeria mitis]